MVRSNCPARRQHFFCQTAYGNLRGRAINQRAKLRAVRRFNHFRTIPVNDDHGLYSRLYSAPDKGTMPASIYARWAVEEGGVENAPAFLLRFEVALRVNGNY